MCLALLRPGDLLLFSSGSLHFATNGADGVNAALYHGWLTAAAVPALCAAALAEEEKTPFTEAERRVRK
eukprot:396447-Prorocentrum_minimum.AAC.1